MPREATPALVMLGPDLRARGGIASVLRVWQAAGLTAGRPVLHLATYVDGSAPAKLAALVRALLRFCALLLTGRVAAVHAHSASNASFRRKSLFLALAQQALGHAHHGAGVGGLQAGGDGVGQAGGVGAGGAGAAVDLQDLHGLFLVGQKSGSSLGRRSKTSTSALAPWLSSIVSASRRRAPSPACIGWPLTTRAPRARCT